MLLRYKSGLLNFPINSIKTFRRQWIRPVLILIYFIFLCVVTPLIVYNTVKDGFEKKDQLILIGSLFVFCALPISVFHFMQHLKHFNQPVLQVFFIGHEETHKLLNLFRYRNISFEL